MTRDRRISADHRCPDDSATRGDVPRDARAKCWQIGAEFSLSAGPRKKGSAGRQVSRHRSVRAVSLRQQPKVQVLLPHEGPMIPGQRPGTIRRAGRLGRVPFGVYNQVPAHAGQTRKLLNCIRLSPSARERLQRRSNLHPAHLSRIIATPRRSPLRFAVYLGSGKTFPLVPTLRVGMPSGTLRVPFGKPLGPGRRGASKTACPNERSPGRLPPVCLLQVLSINYRGRGGGRPFSCGGPLVPSATHYPSSHRRS